MSSPRARPSSRCRAAPAGSLGSLLVQAALLAPAAGAVELEVETIACTLRAPLEGLVLATEQAEGGGPVLRAGEKRWPLEDLLFLRVRGGERFEPGPLRLLLRQGGALYAELAGEEGEVLALRHAASPGPWKLDLIQLRALLVPSSFPDEDLARRLEKELLSREPSTDELYSLSGATPAEMFRARIPGILASLGPEGIRFTSNTLGELNLAFREVRAVHLASLERPGKPPGAPGGGLGPVSLFLADGGQLSGSLASLDSTRLRIEHPVLGGIELSLRALREVSFRGGRCRFLSDLEPISVREHRGLLFQSSPYLQERFAWKRDLSVTGTPMRMGGKLYTKGLGVHAYSRLEYELGGEYERFQAELGLDETARPPPEARRAAGTGAVVFRVHLDGRTLLELPRSWRDPPEPVDLPVAAGKRLALEMDFAAGEIPTRARANWGGARLIRPRTPPPAGGGHEAR